jgi:cell wall-associated NlpC family hydrolase
VPNILKNDMMKNFFFILFTFFFLLSCSTIKPATSSSNSNSDRNRSHSITFIDNISVNPQSHTDRTGYSSESSSQEKQHADFRYSNRFLSNIETYSSLQFKYAIIIDAPVEEMDNERLLQFMEEWYGTRYHYGGINKDGIDCSAFVSLLMSSVYGINNLPRMSKDQFIATPRVSKINLQEGDLVFFHTYGRKKKTVTHVGVYLRNNKFIHASVSGVMISDLGEDYYAAHYVGAGRVTALLFASSK